MYICIEHDDSVQPSYLFRDLSAFLDDHNEYMETDYKTIKDFNEGEEYRTIYKHKHTMEKDNTFTLTQEITYENFENLLVGALEGGSNYWYWLPDEGVDATRKWWKEIGADDSEPLSTKISKFIWEGGGEVPITDCEGYGDDGEVWVLNKARVIEGFRLMATNHPRHWEDFKRENHDAITADVWFQLALFDEIVFG